MIKVGPSHPLHQSISEHVKTDLMSVSLLLLVVNSFVCLSEQKERGCSLVFLLCLCSDELLDHIVLFIICVLLLFLRCLDAFGHRCQSKKHNQKVVKKEVHFLFAWTGDLNL